MRWVCLWALHTTCKEWAPLVPEHRFRALRDQTSGGALSSLVEKLALSLCDMYRRPSGWRSSAGHFGPGQVLQTPDSSGPVSGIGHLAGEDSRIVSSTRHHFERQDTLLWGPKTRPQGDPLGRHCQPTRIQRQALRRVPWMLGGWSECRLCCGQLTYLPTPDRQP
ncbi:uncharacterized protein LOC143645694 [Tamandua tetradactyla]|uniref:uncharacterized protein LOC143645694 n=1 Tax=Tamandua tetradactyla TaxID=48850 RepID=UPI004053FFC5